MAKRSRFSIKPFTNPSGQRVYRVQGRMPNGDRIRLNFQSHEQAQAKRDELEIKAANSSVTLKPTRLTDEQLADAEAAFRKLPGKSLLAIVEDYIAKGTHDLSNKLVTDAVDEFLIEKAKKNLRPMSMLELRSRVGLLKKVFPAKAVSEVIPADLRGVIFAPKLKPRTSGHLRSKLHTFFEWCRRNRYCSHNPVSPISAPIVDDHSPEILSLSEVLTLVSNAVKFKKGKLVPYVVLSLFGGLRPTEVRNLAPSDIKLKERVIIVQGGSSKHRRRRVVHIRANLKKWLETYLPNRIVHSNFPKDFDNVRRMSGFKGAQPKLTDDHLKKWVPDGRVTRR
jgi:site-specific recombinase XerD